MTIELSRADRDMMHGVIDMHLHAIPASWSDRSMRSNVPSRPALLDIAASFSRASMCPMPTEWSSCVRCPWIDLFGSIVLNHPVGGLNPEALSAAIGFGVKVVWLPTVHAAHHQRHFGMPTYPWQTALGLERTRTKAEPLLLLDAEGGLKPEVAEIIALCKQADLVLGTGHVSLDEVMAVLRESRRIGFERVVITHVGWHATDWPIEALTAMLALGCTFEFTVNPLMPNRQQASPKDFANRIRAVGVENCVASTDLGQHDNAHPIEGFRMWLRILVAHGFSAADIDVMARRNPARLLGLSALT